MPSFELFLSAITENVDLLLKIADVKEKRNDYYICFHISVIPLRLLLSVHVSVDVKIR